MAVSYSAFGIQRWRVLLAVAALVAAIAVIDWRVAQEVSLGFLYFFPIFLAASCLSQWQLAALAAVCTLLREALGPFESDIPLLALSRMFLAWGSYTAAGWLVRGILKNFQKVKEQLEEIEARDRLLHDSEEQLRIPDRNQFGRDSDVESRRRSDSGQRRRKPPAGPGAVRDARPERVPLLARSVPGTH